MPAIPFSPAVALLVSTASLLCLCNGSFELKDHRGQNDTCPVMWRYLDCPMRTAKSCGAKESKITLTKDGEERSIPEYNSELCRCGTSRKTGQYGCHLESDLTSASPPSHDTCPFMDHVNTCAADSSRKALCGADRSYTKAGKELPDHLSGDPCHCGTHKETGEYGCHVKNDLATPSPCEMTIPGECSSSDTPCKDIKGEVPDETVEVECVCGRYPPVYGTVGCWPKTWVNKSFAPGARKWRPVKFPHSQGRPLVSPP